MSLWLGWSLWLLVAHLWVKIDIGGDLALGRGIGQSIWRAGPEKFFQPLRRHLQESDFAWANLEGAVRSGPKRQAAPNRPDLSFPPGDLELLSHSGFQGLGLANNHSLDQGGQGFAETAHGLRELGLMPLSGWNVREIRSLALKILSLSYAPAPGAKPAWAYAFPDQPGREAILGEVRTAAETGVVLVYLHGGQEDVRTTTPAEDGFFRELIEHGAAGVFGHHSHTIKPAQAHRGRPIFPSLGSVLFDRRGERWNGGLLVRLHFWAGNLLAVRTSRLRPRPGSWQPLLTGEGPAS